MRYKQTNENNKNTITEFFEKKKYLDLQKSESEDDEQKIIV